MNWETIIGSYAFPIVACCAMAFYVKYITDKNDTEVKYLNEQHKTEMLAFKDEITKAINNNTLVMQKLCDNLGKEVNNND